MAAKTTAASVDKARRGFQQRTGVTLSSRSAEPLPVLSNANRARNTEKVLEELGQRDQARGSNTFSVEAAKSGSPIMSGWVNAMADNPKLANAATFLAGASLPYSEFRRQQDEKMKGTLTDEMQSAGLTQADLDAWNRQQNEIERQNVLSQYAKEHPIMSSLNAIPENAFGSIEGNIDKVIDYVKGNPIQSRQTNADIYRLAVTENIDSKLGRGAYGVANSIGDMLFASWLTGGLGGGGGEAAKGIAKLLRGLPAASVMGLEKSNQTMNSAAERGLTNNQALAEGVLSGLSTAATEALPFGRFAEGGNILGSMAAEGLQEGAEGLLDTFFDELVTRVGGNGDKSELKTRYREYLNAGYNAEQARQAVANDYKTQVLTDIVMGGLAGGVMQGGSNALSGRNIITGKIPSLNQNTEVAEEVQTEQQNAQPTEDEEALDYLRDVLEDANQMELHPENVGRNEQIQQQAPEAQQIPKVKQTVNYDWSQNVYGEAPARNIDTDLYKQYAKEYDTILREYGITDNALALAEDINKAYDNIVSAETATQQQNAIERFNYLINLANETLENRTDDFYINNRVESQPAQTQPIEVLRNEAAETAIRNREAAQYAREVESLKGKLKMFGNKTFNKRLDAALKDVQSGKEGAVENLNNLINEINETMAGEEIGVNAREFNSDRYKVMQEATDGYRVRIDPNLVKNEYDVKGLDDFNRNYMNTGSPDHIKLVSPNYKGTALNIDRVYDELYGMNIGLEPPNGRSESDLLRSLVKFINEPKSGRDETVMNSTWENTPAMDNRTNIEVEADNLVDDLLNKMADRNATEEDYLRFIDFVLEKGKGQSEEVQDYLNDLFVNVSEVWKSMPKSNIPLDEDVQNIPTLEEAITKLDEELGSHPYNLKFFARNQNNEVISEDSDRVQTGRYKTSKEYTNTAERSGNLTDDQRRMVEQNGSMLYQENSERESVFEAEKRIIKDGWENEYERLTSKDMKDFNNVDVDELFMVWRHYTEEARTLDEKGLDSTSAWQKAYDCFVQTKAVGSSAGSELQAFAKWSRNNTPEGLLSQAGTIIEEVKRGAKKNPWFAQIAKETKGKTKEMDVPFIKEFLTEAEKLAPTHTVKEGETLAQIAQQYNTTVDALIALNGNKIKPGDKITVNRLDIDSREAKHIMANLGKMVNGQIPVTLREKVVTILMDNMLGNFRTLIARNAGGNVGFNLIEQNVTKQLAAKIDKVLSEKRGTTRTISENTKEGRQAGREGFKEALKQEIYDFQNNIQSARSGENNLRTAVANNRTIFNEKNVFGKIGNLYNKLVKAGLSSGDRPFYERVYSQYMTEFKKMREDGLLKEMTDAEFEKLAKTNAQLKALEAVYQDDSSIAQAFIQMKNAVNELSKGIVGADVLSQFTMPFVKTPANIIQRAIEYSPIGIVKNAIQTVREVNHSMTENEIMDFDQQRFATETARNLIGSVMFAVAVMAAKSGALTGGYSEDKDMAQAQREAGMQEYALHNPLGFNGDVDVSWLPVLGNNMVAAAAAYDAASKPELTTAQRIGQGLTAGLRTQFESSALQGLQRLVGGSNYSSSNGGDLLTNAVDTLKSGATQFIPSLARQAASTADPYRRQLTGANPDDYYMNSVLNSIPGLRQSLEPRITRTGEYMEQNAGRSGLWKAFDNFINPATITRGTEDAVRDEAMRLFEATGNNIAFQPGVTINDLKSEDHVPTAEEFTQYQQNAYGAMNQIATQVINSSYYQNLTDGEKETLLDSIYKAVKSVEKANILGTDKSNLSGAAKAYDEGGAEGMMDYFTAKETLDSMGATNNPQNRELVTEAMNNGTFDEMEQLGFDVNLIKKYQHAADRIPSLNPTTFQQQFNAIDTSIDGTGNNSITQKEIIAYLNQNPTGYNEEEALRIWDAYLQSYGKIPVFDPDKGTWSAK